MPSEEQATGTLEEIGQRDHSVTAEYRIFGAPGCGKTTNITRQVKRAVEKHGADAVLVTSYSRTAAAELAAANPSIPIVAVSDAGHMVPWDNYDEFLRCLMPLI